MMTPSWRGSWASSTSSSWPRRCTSSGNRSKLALRDKLRAERIDPTRARDAQGAFEAARASYLAKARELRTAQRRLSNAKEPREPGPPEPADPTTPSDDRVVRGPSANTPGPHPSAAAIGSIDVDAVFKRYEKVKVSNKEFSAALCSERMS